MALYRQLFATNPYRIDLINRTSSNLFVEFQWLVIDSMIISLSKLTDAARMRKNENLSFHYLNEILREMNEEALAQELAKELQELVNICEKFRNIRNKRVAHNDLFTALQKEGAPLPGVSLSEIETALKHSRNIMNNVELHFDRSQTLYDKIILPLANDGRSVLIWLQKGLAYEKLEDDGAIEDGLWRELGDLDA